MKHLLLLLVLAPLCLQAQTADMTDSAYYNTVAEKAKYLNNMRFFPDTITKKLPVNIGDTLKKYDWAMMIVIEMRDGILDVDYNNEECQIIRFADDTLMQVFSVRKKYEYYTDYDEVMDEYTDNNLESYVMGRIELARYNLVGDSATFTIDGDDEIAIQFISITPNGMVWKLKETYYEDAKPKMAHMYLVPMPKNVTIINDMIKEKMSYNDDYGYDYAADSTVADDYYTEDETNSYTVGEDVMAYSYVESYLPGKVLKTKVTEYGETMYLVKYEKSKNIKLKKQWVYSYDMYTLEEY